MDRNDSRYMLALALASLAISIIFILSRANGTLTANYDKVFTPIVWIITLLWFGIYIFETKVNRRPFFANETMPFSSLSRLPLYSKLLIVGVVLAVIFSLGAIGLKSPIIDVPQPFTEQGFSQVTEYDKVFFQSVIPGFYEESAIFMLVLAIKYIGIMLIGFRNPRSFFLILIIASAVGAGALTQAHRLAYGSDAGAYIGIFTFEFTMQFMNLYSGAFISWIPHIVHNGVVALSFLVAFSIGGTAFNFMLLRRKKDGLL